MEFHEAGAHCSLGECRERDFLPFTCDACDKVFCLNHRTYRTHRCPHERRRDLQVVLCPICKSSFQIYASEAGEVDRMVDEHIRMGGCEAAKRAKKAKKDRTACHVKGCRKAELQPLRCKQCTRLVCLAHRFPADHQCGGRGSRPVPGGGGARPRVGGKPKPKPKPAARRPAAGPATAAGTAAARRRPQQQQQQQAAGWSCTACTFVNAAALQRCEMCRAARPAAARRPAATAGGGSSASKCVVS